MKEFWNTIQLVFTAVGGWLGWFLGGCDGLLYALLIFVTLDYLTGYAGHRYRQHPAHGSHFLLSFQRRRLPGRERSTPWPSDPGEAEGSAGAAP